MKNDAAFALYQQKTIANLILLDLNPISRVFIFVKLTFIGPPCTNQLYVHRRASKYLLSFVLLYSQCSE
jgi:hypothetical protein